jgi:ElaB/YqjD/DUF883 family membrane-anchored ribosome-binding protein
MIENKISQQSNGVADQVAASADHAIQATQHAANEALKSLADSVIQLRNQATPLINRATDQANALMNNGLETVRNTSHQLTETALRARDGTVNYVKDEPVKSILIAAATGAALMALVSMISHSQRRA